MIKINLLAEGKRPVAVRKAKTGPAPPSRREWAVIWLILATLAGAAAFGGWWWMKNREIEQNRHEIARAEKEVKALEQIIKEVEAYKARQAELRHKIDVIEQLRANQKGPVQVMDEVSRALPELLWLDKMEVRGSQISISGRAFNSNAVANFIENLTRVPGFEEPNLADLREQRAGIYTFKFTINYRLSRATTEGDGTDAEAAAGATAAAGG